MSYLAPLFTLQWRLLRNTYWRTRQQQITTSLVMAGGAGLAVGLAYFLSDFLDPAWGWIAFALVATFIFFASVTTSLVNLIPRFYRSPDLNYLLALPIPANQVLAVKFLAVQLQSSLGVLFLSLALLIAVGWGIAAPWYYYAAVLPFFWVFTLVPAGIGLLLGMALLRVMTTQTLSLLAGALSLGTTVAWFLIAGRPLEQLMPVLVRAAELFGWLSPLAELMSPISAGQLLYALASAAPAQGLRPLLMLLLVTGVTMLAVFWLARHLFYQGWLLTQSAPASLPRKTVRLAGGAIHPPLMAAVLTQWRLAQRNKEAWFVCFVLVAGYLALIFFLIEGRLLVWLGGSPAAALVAIILGTTTLLPWGLSVLFVPLNQLAQAGNAKAVLGLFKRSLWLFKALPLTTAEVVLTEALKVTAPAFLLGAAGILAFVLLGEAASGHALLALVGLALLQLSLAVITTWLEYWSYGPGEKLSPAMVNLLQLLIPLVYLLAAAGPLTLYLLAGVIPGLAHWQSQLLLLGGLLSWPLVSLLAIWVGWRLAVRSWEAMEID